MPQQPPHYTLIIRLPFPRPQNSAFNSVQQPQIQPQNQQQAQTQTQTQAHQQQKKSTPPPPTTTTTASTPPTKPPSPPPKQQQQHHQQPPTPPPDRQPSTTDSPAPAPSSGRSEGTPSMGSSFSDLSGASVAQSALEEALMSDLRADGGVGFGSRVSATGFEGRR